MSILSFLDEQVKRDHHELFKQYAPIWAKEEVERASLWTTFLLSFAADAQRCSHRIPAWVWLPICWPPGSEQMSTTGED